MKTKNKFVDDVEFKNRFRTERDCLDYLVSLRWPDGYCCPRCGCKEMWEVIPYKYKCCKCNYQTSVTAGTLFHHTHVSISQWFQAIWYMSIRGNQITASELKNEIDIGSNRTALSMIRKIKSEMFTMNENSIIRRLDGNIDVCINHENNILTAVEVINRKIGHIRLYQMPEYNKECFRQFVLDNIEIGSNIRREHNHYKLGYTIDGYSFKIRRPEYYEAPFAKITYSNFEEYFNERCNNKKSSLKIMDEYTCLINSFTDDLSFDEIIHNMFAYEPRKNPLKQSIYQ